MCMKKPLETAWVGLQVGWGGVSGNHQGRANSVSLVVGDSDMAPACWLCGRMGPEKEQGLCQHFFL